MTCKAPVVVLVAIVVPVIDNDAIDEELNVPLIVPPTFRLPPIPTPPIICNAPVVVLDDAIGLENTDAPAMDTPPETTKAPVDGTVLMAAVVLAIVTKPPDATDKLLAKLAAPV